jgi:replicative DNA helicase
MVSNSFSATRRSRAARKVPVRIVDQSLGEITQEQEVLGEGTLTVPAGGIDALKAVRLFSLTGSLAAVAKELNVPIYALKKLSRTEMWARELADLQQAEAALLNVKMSKILDMSLDMMADRLEHGDFTVSAGKLVRSPLAATTLARAADCVFDKQRLLRELPTTIIGGENKKLATLAQRLRALGAKDIEYLDQDAEEIPPAALPSQERAFSEH